MTLHRDRGHDFLIFSHGTMGFLVNRNQFSSSLFIDRIESEGTEMTAQCPGTINFGGRRLLLLDIHQYLGKLFGFTHPGSADLAIVMPLSLFTSEAAECMFIQAACGRGVDRQYIAVKLPNQSTIEHISLGHLRLVPAVIRNQCRRFGVFALRFENAMIYYVIDLVVMITHMMGDET